MREYIVIYRCEKHLLFSKETVKQRDLQSHTSSVVGEGGFSMGHIASFALIRYACLPSVGEYQGKSCSVKIIKMDKSGLFVHSCLNISEIMG